MALHTVKEREDTQQASIRPIFPVTETVSGFNGAVTITSVTDSMSMLRVVGFDWASNATVGASFGGVFYAGGGEYDPGFVARILRADAEPPEAKFDNVVDMLNWLERD